MSLFSLCCWICSLMAGGFCLGLDRSWEHPKMTSKICFSSSSTSSGVRLYRVIWNVNVSMEVCVFGMLEVAFSDNQIVGCGEGQQVQFIVPWPNLLPRRICVSRSGRRNLQPGRSPRSVGSSPACVGVSVSSAGSGLVSGDGS